MSAKQTTAAAPEQGYLIRRGSNYLERIPATKRWMFLAGSPQHATVFNLKRAAFLATIFDADINEDPLNRPPQFTA